MLERRRAEKQGRAAKIAALLLALAVGGCGGQNPVMTPVGWWHDLTGGAIAADRPPPPGADLPYPKIASIPPKPVLPSASYRQTVETQLAQERDDTERLAARTPIVVEVSAPPPPPLPAPAAGMEGTPDPATANATLPAADAAPAPAPKAEAAPVAASDGGPAAGAPLTIAGLPGSDANLPDMPAAPPPPATFEGVAAEPAPTPTPPLPAHVPLAAGGTPVFFRPDDAVLDGSQTITIKDVASHRGKGSIQVEGHGDAQSDSPLGQEAALGLALQRAQVVAVALEAQRVPGSAIRIAATPFGRGAALILTP